MTSKLLSILLLFLSLPQVGQTFSPSQNDKHPHFEKSIFQMHNKSFNLFSTTFYIGKNRFVTDTHILFPNYEFQTLTELYNDFSEEGNITEENKQKIISHFNLLTTIPDLYIKTDSIEIPLKNIVAIDFKNDLMILETTQKYFDSIEKFIPLKIGLFSKNLSTRPGFIYGFPKNNPLFYHEKHKPKEMSFESLRYMDSNAFTAYTNSNHLQGASGSPVLIDGSIVGIVRAAVQNSITAISSNILTELLNKKPISITKNNKLIHTFLSSLQEAKKDIKMNLEETWISLEFLHKTEDMYSYQKQTIDERINKLENLIRQNPNFTPAYELLVEYYISLGNIEKLFDLSKEYKEPSFLYITGMLRLEDGNLHQALRDFKEAAEGDYNPALFAIAIYHFVNGDKELYEKYIKEAANRGHLLARLHFNEQHNKPTFIDGSGEKVTTDHLFLILRNNPNYFSSEYFMELFQNLL